MTEKKAIKVAICTSYLTDDLAAERGEEYAKKQTERFGYDPNNFKDVRLLETPKHIVLLETNDNHTIRQPELADLVVIGSTESAEEFVMKIRGSGAIVARYSIFYGGCCRYSGNTPDEGGYSLDIPKKVEAVKSFLTNDGVLDALVAREERKFRTALKEFNDGRDQPVLITPYFKEALKVKR